MEKDYMGAKKFALKAQNLFPAFESVIQLISTLDVYIASEHKANGENDWYSILQVNSTADEDTVKKQYRKLALLLHPDKNKSVGAEDAFKLISEAWSVLSDKSRRMLHDQKVQKSNGFYKFSKNTVKTHIGSSSPRVLPQPLICLASHRHLKSAICSTSLKVYVNHTLLCPKLFQLKRRSLLPADCKLGASLSAESAEPQLT